MNRILKIGLAAIIGLMVTFGAGWWYGSRGAAAQQAENANVDYSLSTARGALLEGRLELYSNNFGNAARHFDSAKRDLSRAIEALVRDGATEPAAALRQASTSIDAAIQRAGRLETAAHESAAAAQKEIDAVVQQRRTPR